MLSDLKVCRDKDAPAEWKVTERFGFDSGKHTENWLPEPSAIEIGMYSK